MELEYKFALENAAQGNEIIQSTDGGLPDIHVLDSYRLVMASHYFDTPSRALRKAGWSLRLRGENEKSVLCIKHAKQAKRGGLRVREEYECEADSLEDGLALIREKGVDEEFFRLIAEGVTELVQVHFIRTARLVRYGGARAELAFDEGYFGSDADKNRFTEFEIEYKAGEEADFSRLAQDLSAQFGLFPQEKSKLARALEAKDKEA